MNELKHFVFFLIAILNANYGFAQTANSQLVAKEIFKINAILPGVSYEHALGKSTTLYLSPYLNGIITDTFESIDRKHHLIITPCFDMGYRNYYNIKHRFQKGLRTSFNNANYFSTAYILRYTKISNPGDYTFLHQVALGSGIQRNYLNGFALDIQGGLKYSFNANHILYYSPLKFYVQISLGYWIGKKKSN